LIAGSFAISITLFLCFTILITSLDKGTQAMQSVC